MGPSDAGTAGRVIDGLTDATSPRTDTTGSSPTPWIQVDLGTVQAIETVRVWNRTDALNRNLDDFSVFVSEADPSSISDDPTVLGADPAVFAQRFQAGVDGYVAGYPVTTALTLENGQPKQGRYVRVQLHDRGGSRSLGLLEIQVFGPDQVEPPRYPSRVEKVDADHFRVEVFDRSLGTSGAWKSLTLAGELLWAPTSAQVGFPLIGNATGLTVDWNLQNYTEDIGFVGTTTETSTSVGLELEIEASLLGSGLSLAGGQSISNGITRESVRTTTTSDGLLMGGFVDNLPSQASSVCRYQILPYYYVTEVVSDYGFKHELRVLDYLVSDEAPYLTRVDQDYGPCLRPDPEIAVEEIGAGIRIADGASASSASNGTDFGPTLVGESLARTFRITNLSAAANLVLGPAPVVSIDQAGGSAWAVALQPATTTLAPGASTQFRIEFTPSAEGSFPATVHVASNDGVGAADFDFAIGAQTVPLAVDTDLDGLTNGQELALGTDWQNPDTDGDGISDGDEVAAGTSPLDPRDPPPPLQPAPRRRRIERARRRNAGRLRADDRPRDDGRRAQRQLQPDGDRRRGDGDRHRWRGLPRPRRAAERADGPESHARSRPAQRGRRLGDADQDPGPAGRRVRGHLVPHRRLLLVGSERVRSRRGRWPRHGTAGRRRQAPLELDLLWRRLLCRDLERRGRRPDPHRPAEHRERHPIQRDRDRHPPRVPGTRLRAGGLGAHDLRGGPRDRPDQDLPGRARKSGGRDLRRRRPVHHRSLRRQQPAHRRPLARPRLPQRFGLLAAGQPSLGDRRALLLRRLRGGEPNGDCNAFVDRECGSGYFDVYAGAWNDFGADGLQQILVEYPLSDPARASRARSSERAGHAVPAVAPLQDGTRLDFPAAPGALLFDLPMTAPGASRRARTSASVSSRRSAARRPTTIRSS
ncbi:MAG: choice-of-anchor D domain-containing protein [Myxococcota bacterium]